MIYLSYKENGTFINLITLLFGPYLIIVPLNNLYFVNTGFYAIEELTMIYLALSMFVYFLGTSLIRKNKYSFTPPQDESIFNDININAMTKFLYLIDIIALLKMIIAFKYGLFYSQNIDDTEGYMSSGPVGHLMLIAYVITPFVFLYWTYKRNFYYLLPVIIILLCSFSTLVKYHCIGLIIMIYLFVGTYRKKIFFKSTLLLFLSIVSVFCLNYFATFFVKDTFVDNQFYINHFWKYVAGSIIYDNYVYGDMINSTDSIFNILLGYFSTLPNMFLSKIDIHLFSQTTEYGFRNLSYIGEHGNVICAFGLLYPSNTTWADVLLYFLVLFLIGFFSKYLYLKRLRKTNVPDIFIIAFLTYFVSLCFFANYAVLSGPWEILVYSLIIPPFFYKNKIHPLKKLFNRILTH